MSTIFLGDPPPGPESRTFQQGLYTETGPFLSTPVNPSSVTAQVTLSPAPASGSGTSPLLLAALFETMGNCEGPLTYPKIGDGGTVTTTFTNGCGTITDTFSVVSDGSGSAPYEIQHNLGGSTLTLTGLPALSQTATVNRTANITIGATTASGQIQVASGGTTLCTGSLSGNNLVSHSTVPLPWPCALSSMWTTYAASTGIATGSVVRQQVTTASAPALPAGGVATLMLLLLPLGVWAVRRSMGGVLTA